MSYERSPDAITTHETIQPRLRMSARVPGTRYRIPEIPGLPFRLRVSHPLDHAPSPHPAHQTGRADHPHPIPHLMSVSAVAVSAPSSMPLSSVSRALTATSAPTILVYLPPAETRGSPRSAHLHPTSSPVVAPSKPLLLATRGTVTQMFARTREARAFVG